MVFAENDAVEGQFDDDSQNMMECLPEPNLIIPLNAFDPGSVQSAFTTVGAVCQTLEAACRLIDLMPGNEKWVTDSEAQHGSSSRDRHPAWVFKVTDSELFVRALDKDERPAGNAPLKTAPDWNADSAGRVCLGSMRLPDDVG
jgi:hypothetical protein